MMKKTAKIKYNKDKDEVTVEIITDDPQKKLDKPNVYKKDNGDVVIISNEDEIILPKTLWNHGSGWNSITLEG